MCKFTKLFVLMIALSFIVGCSKDDKQNISKTVNKVSNAVNGNLEEKVLKQLKAIQDDNLRAYLDVDYYPKTIQGICSERNANEPDYKKANEIQKCVDKMYETNDYGIKHSSFFNEAVRKLPKTAQYAIIDKKKYDGNNIGYFVKVTYATKEDAPSENSQESSNKVKEAVYHIGCSLPNNTCNVTLGQMDVLSKF